ncbi:MAG: hypothetical protein LAN18_10680 [Acidobacteriia bacterium]|nr:hypothetical protein [Terriglobia bacterium]
MTANPCTPSRNEPSAIEKASAAVIQSINDAITAHFIHYRVAEQVDEKTFRAIVAGYFERKSLKEWCQDLGITPPENDA